MSAVGPVLPYSTDPAAAQQVVERILLSGDLAVNVESRSNPNGGLAHSCTVTRAMGSLSDSAPVSVTANADSAPLAICRAALLNESR